MAIKKLLIITSCAIMSITHALGSDGALDTTFGTINSFTAYASAIQADGKVVVTGVTEAGLIQTMRYLSNGLADTSFGSDGIATDAEGTAYTLLLQSDGNIVIGGQLANGKSFVYRYRNDGTLDASFGNQGRVIGVTGATYALSMQLDSTLLVGESNDNTNTSRVTRYTSRGYVDTHLQTVADIRIRSIVIQPDDTIMIGGTDNTDALVLLRCLASGTLDQSFGTGGVIQGPAGILVSLVLQPDGKLLAGGHTTSINPDFQLVRFLSDGTLDSSFGIGGITTGPNGTVSSMLLQPDGKPILIGKTPDDVFQLARYTTAGILDTNFNNTGIVTNSLTAAYTGALQADGKILVIGSSDDPFSHAQIVRYMNSNAFILPAITNPVDEAVLPYSTFNFSGTTEYGSRVFLCVDGVMKDGAITDNTNQWVIPALVPASGPHTVHVIAEHRYGNVSIASPTISLTIE